MLTSPDRFPVPPLLLGAVALAALLLAPLGCGGGEAEPVAHLALEPGEVDLPYGSFTDLELSWTPRAELGDVTGHLRVFAHLLDAEGRLSRTFDEDVPGVWQVGEAERTPLRIYQSLMAPPLAPGDYTLTAGLYDDSGRRWPLETAGKRRGQGEYAMVTVHVPGSSQGHGKSQGPQLPDFEFSRTWSANLAGADRQVIAFRWLYHDGSIRLTHIRGPGTLWARIQIPSVDTGAMRRQIEDGTGSEEARVALSADCSGFEAGVSGAGSHDVDIPVAPEDGQCVIGYDPNFTMVPKSPEVPQSDAGRSMLLEVLAWKQR